MKLLAFKLTNLYVKPVTSPITLNGITFDVPPPGAGFATVTLAVEAAATSVELMLAVSCDALTNVVERGEPFQFTTELATKLAPRTVRLKPELPGAITFGDSG
jgi:hypothetical protein